MLPSHLGRCLCSGRWRHQHGEVHAWIGVADWEKRRGSTEGRRLLELSFVDVCKERQSSTNVLGREMTKSKAQGYESRELRMNY